MFNTISYPWKSNIPWLSSNLRYHLNQSFSVQSNASKTKFKLKEHFNWLHEIYSEQNYLCLISMVYEIEYSVRINILNGIGINRLCAKQGRDWYERESKESLQKIKCRDKHLVYKWLCFSFHFTLSANQSFYITIELKSLLNKSSDKWVKNRLNIQIIELFKRLSKTHFKTQYLKTLFNWKQSVLSMIKMIGNLDMTRIYI